MALWLAVRAGRWPGMLLCLGGEAVDAGGRAGPGAGRAAGRFPACCCRCRMVPMAVANVLRTFVSALGRPVFATVITGVGDRWSTRLGNYALVFGHFGVPRAGSERLGASPASSPPVPRLLAYCLAIALDRRLRRFRIFGRWWRPEWQRLREMLALGLPIALTLMAEGGLFSAAAFLMGRIGEAQLAGAHRGAADRRVRVPGAVRHRPGGDDPRGLSLRRGQQRRRSAARAGPRLSIGMASWSCRLARCCWRRA